VVILIDQGSLVVISCFGCNILFGCWSYICLVRYTWLILNVLSDFVLSRLLLVDALFVKIFVNIGVFSLSCFLHADMIL
jgi:hypothetical protein